MKIQDLKLLLNEISNGHDNMLTVYYNMWLIDLKSISYQKEIKEVQEQISSVSTK